VAAREVARGSHSVLVGEARDRVGGRCSMFEEYVDGRSVYNSSGPLGRQE
jgi:monoamine oxidase